MAKGFAEQSHGALILESELNRGTQVHLFLPAAIHEVLQAQDVTADTDSHILQVTN